MPRKYRKIIVYIMIATMLMGTIFTGAAMFF
ncbi:MAG: stressosome-associated protein Prli42 [Anaerobacillus sp.]|uniref:Stressosome-associated protein Prli42 n=1 Tax=Anaerobacillus isosaccharinicus TaxID=1532552 RepID=A0A7S7L7V9_9BACI|nr:stressosome-associated protein Prli42 [Anaerobacillus isosaccharinicus]MBA5585665.1 stressosome-associated protein Prli42 [Anaerobacillus isosaccharinicus]QOY36027.1 stressosome-associated protein Prli42 [Anaerobacillus isosaccharinicus]